MHAALGCNAVASIPTAISIVHSSPNLAAEEPHRQEK